MIPADLEVFSTELCAQAKAERAAKRDALARQVARIPNPGAGKLLGHLSIISGRRAEARLYAGLLFISDGTRIADVADVAGVDDAVDHLRASVDARPGASFTPAAAARTSSWSGDVYTGRIFYA